MRIGLFSDVYLPTVNGISYVLDIMHEQLTALGHDVFIFAPASNLRGKEYGDPDYVYRFPAVEGVFFDQQLTSVFFPLAAYLRIKKLNLDIIHFFTPGQIGLLGMYTAMRQDITLVGQYSTDLYRYVEQYPKVLPGTIALSLTAPLILKLTPRELMRAMGALRPRRTITSWHKNLVMRMHVEIHNKCDAVIALSPKMKLQLDTWGSDTTTTLLPTGVDEILVSNKTTAVKNFKKKHKIPGTAKVILYTGRVSREKNILMVIDAFERIAKDHDAVLVIAGAVHSDDITKKVNKSKFHGQIILTGKYERSDAGAIYGAADIFAFASLTDTQGLVINEAAAAGLPLVLCDDSVSVVFKDGSTGLLAKNSSNDFANKLNLLLSDDRLRASLGKKARACAKQYSELAQMKKLEQLYKNCLDDHSSESLLV